ncbi:MAG TPA: hydroxymethylbilane synthase [Brevundimonas sp.]|jgi:hydroxymethylbilane synthase|uniref:hydroxymethylbilane synthase n=1 Tax=Brevundimonas sp. TaxID=1871086 RepID=UPI002DE7FD32|nr:hydroxymethylbilane synthase [Brevundimonas sp.]
MDRPIRIGTRKSRLALAQSGMVRDAVARTLGAAPGEEEQFAVLVPIVTEGDRIQDRRLMEIGGKALFTRELEECLQDGRLDLAVHSMKDVPADMPGGLTLAAVPEREDARDAFLGRDARRLIDLPHGARLGTASLRRQAQCLALRPDLTIDMLRGNVDTRMRRLAEGDFDAILLAVAGLSRLGMADAIHERLSLDDFPPAPGQGALALQARLDVAESDWLVAQDHAPTRLSVEAERGAMAVLEGSCRTAVAAHGVWSGDVLTLTVEWLSPDGRRRVRRAASAAPTDGEEARALGLDLGAQVRAEVGPDLVP